jgi:hypothetical protein
VTNLRKLVFISVTTLGFFGLAGCSRDPNIAGRPKLVPARGHITHDGKPLAGAHITFINTALNRSAHAISDSDGSFVLSTFDDKDGAVPGKQLVSVSKVEMLHKLDPSIDRTTMKAPKNPAGPERRWLIPEKYGSTTTSGLTAEIGESGNKEIVLELKGAGGVEGIASSAKPKSGDRPDR